MTGDAFVTQAISYFNGLSSRLGSVVFIVVYLLPKLRPSVASLSGLPVCPPQPSAAQRYLGNYFDGKLK